MRLRYVVSAFFLLLGLTSREALGQVHLQEEVDLDRATRPAVRALLSADSTAGDITLPALPFTGDLTIFYEDAGRILNPLNGSTALTVRVSDGRQLLDAFAGRMDSSAAYLYNTQFCNNGNISYDPAYQYPNAAYNSQLYPHDPAAYWRNMPGFDAGRVRTGDSLNLDYFDGYESVPLRDVDFSYDTFSGPFSWYGGSGWEGVGVDTLFYFLTFSHPMFGSVYCNGGGNGQWERSYLAVSLRLALAADTLGVSASSDGNTLHGNEWALGVSPSSGGYANIQLPEETLIRIELDANGARYGDLIGPDSVRSDQLTVPLSALDASSVRYVADGDAEPDMGYVPRPVSIRAVKEDEPDVDGEELLMVGGHEFLLHPRADTLLPGMRVPFTVIAIDADSNEVFIPGDTPVNLYTGLGQIVGPDGTMARYFEAVPYAKVRADSFAYLPPDEFPPLDHNYWNVPGESLWDDLSVDEYPEDWSYWSWGYHPPFVLEPYFDVSIAPDSIAIGDTTYVMASAEDRDNPSFSSELQVSAAVDSAHFGTLVRQAWNEQDSLWADAASGSALTVSYAVLDTTAMPRPEVRQRLLFLPSGPTPRQAALRLVRTGDIMKQGRGIVDMVEPPRLVLLRQDDTPIPSSGEEAVLMVSKLAPTDRLASSTLFNSGMPTAQADSFTFRPQIQGDFAGKTVAINIQVVRNGTTVPGYNPDVATDSSTVDGLKTYRANEHFRLVSDAEDDGILGNQTILVKLGDQVRFTLKLDGQPTNTKLEVPVGRPSPEDNINAIRRVDLNWLVLHDAGVVPAPSIVKDRMSRAWAQAGVYFSNVDSLVVPSDPDTNMIFLRLQGRNRTGQSGTVGVSLQVDGYTRTVGIPYGDNLTAHGVAEHIKFTLANQLGKDANLIYVIPAGTAGPAQARLTHPSRIQDFIIAFHSSSGVSDVVNLIRTDKVRLRQYSVRPPYRVHELVAFASSLKDERHKNSLDVLVVPGILGIQDVLGLGLYPGVGASGSDNTMVLVPGAVASQPINPYAAAHEAGHVLMRAGHDRNNPEPEFNLMRGPATATPRTDGRKRLTTAQQKLGRIHNDPVAGSSEERLLKKED